MIYCGDCLEILKTLPTQSVNCCVTSPPYYGLRDYGVSGQIGLEQSPEEYVSKLVAVFREVRRVLRGDATLWLNLGDSYASSPTGADSKKSKLEGGKTTQYEGGKRQNKIVGDLKPKDLIGIPWRVAFALQADGWYLRQDIIWHKPNPMPESVKDRCTKAHEYVFLMSKSARYFYDAEAVKEKGSGRIAGNKIQILPRNTGIEMAAEGHGIFNAQQRPCETRNRRSVWTIPTKPFKGAHFATFPPALVEPCILAGCPAGGVVLDPFFGSGTVGAEAVRLGRDYIGIELNPTYIDMAERRIKCTQPPLLLELT